MNLYSVVALTRPPSRSNYFNFHHVAKQEFIPVGCVPPTRYRTVGEDVSVQGGLCLRGCLCLSGSLSRGVSVQGVSVQAGLCLRGSLSRRVSVQGVSVQGISVRGVSIQGGLCLGVFPDRDSPVNRITDTCKNITLPQLRCGW